MFMQLVASIMRHAISVLGVAVFGATSSLLPLRCEIRCEIKMQKPSPVLEIILNVFRSEWSLEVFQNESRLTTILFRH